MTLAQARGAKLIVLDPRTSGNAERADIHLPLKAGSDDAEPTPITQLVDCCRQQCQQQDNGGGWDESAGGGHEAVNEDDIPF